MSRRGRGRWRGRPGPIRGWSEVLWVAALLAGRMARKEAVGCVSR
jgi:hypothetical protein